MSEPAAPLPAPPLNHLYFYLTEGCNLACRHCWLAPRHDPAGDRYPTLPVELFQTAIREARPLGLSAVKLTGGEPLLHPRITRLLEIVRDEQLALSIETNGVLCTPRLAAEIGKCPKAFVAVSLDGADAATHEAVRGVAGSFDAACRAVGNLAQAGVKPQVIFTVMRGNAGQVEPMIALTEKLGAASLKFNLVQPTARGETLHQAGQALGVAELVGLGRRVDRELAATTPLRLHFDFPPAFRALSRLADGTGCSVCGVFGILGVLASGHYALCGIGQHVPELVFGEVGKDDLSNVWREHPALLSLREGLPGRLEGVCSRCLMKGVCLGSCVAQNHYAVGNLWGPFWFCREAEQAGLFPASRLTAPLAAAPAPPPQK